MGSPEISIPFLDFVHSKSSETAVFTQKDKIRKRGSLLEPTPVKKRALELGLTVHTLPARSAEAINIIKEFSPDIIFVVAYGQILPPELLKIPKLYPLNVHFSLLPHYRGATPVNSALLNGDSETGTTIMVMNEGLDTGDILFSEKCAIEPIDNASTLFDKLVKLSTALLEKNWNDIATGNVRKTPQTGIATITRLIKKSDLMIDFNEDAMNIHNKIRAFNQYPGIKTVFRQNPVFIERTELCGQKTEVPGSILEVTKDFFTVSCANGAIKILQLKPAGKRSMRSSEFINGYKPSAGEIMG